MSEPEFSRPIRIDTLGPTPRAIEVQAKPAERTALAARFGIAAVDRLDADLDLHRTDQEIVATGRLRADVVQSCVVTDSPVPARVEEAFAVRFRPEPAAVTGDEEIELGEEELDVIFYDGAMVDVGEAVAQTLALALDPYPRAEGAALTQAGAGEGKAGPFGALASLKDKLKGS